MNHKEIALQLTIKAMEFGLIKTKPENFFSGDDTWEQANQFAAKQVNDFYSETLRRLNNL